MKNSRRKDRAGMVGYLTQALAIVIVIVGGLQASSGGQNKVLYEGRILGDLTIAETYEDGINGLFIVMDGKVCMGLCADRGANSDERFAALVLNGDETQLLACTFEGDSIAAVSATDPNRAGVFTLLAGKEKGKWGPAFYNAASHKSNSDAETYCDIDFNGQFDMKGRWKPGEKSYGIANPWVYADGEWREVMEWLAKDRARIREGEGEADYGFVGRRGWLSARDAKDLVPPVATVDTPEWIKTMVGEWKKGGVASSQLAKWRDVEVWERTVKPASRSIVEVSKNGLAIATIIRPSDWRAGRDGDIQIDLLDGHMTDPVVSIHIDAKGVRDVYVWSEGGWGCLWIARNTETEIPWTASYYSTDPVTRLIKGEMYYDIGFDGRMDFKCDYDGLVSEPQSRWVYLQDRWEPVSDISLSQRRGTIKRDRRKVDIEFMPGKGWVEGAGGK